MKSIKIDFGFIVAPCFLHVATMKTKSNSVSYKSENVAKNLRRKSKK
jgi:hypothetical protein